MIRRTLMLLAALAVAVAAARADVPREIPFQFRLTSAAGTPVSAPVSVRFSLYAAPTGGTAIWTESKALTPVDGVANTLLGDATPFSVASPPVNFAAPLYLGVKVGSDAEMTPRLPLSAAPLALALPNVTVDSSGRVGIGTAAPQAALHVNGDILFGASPVVAPVGGEAPLRTIRGMVSSTGDVVLGEGFSVVRAGGVGSGGYDIRFNAYFSDIPVVVAAVARYGQGSAVTELVGSNHCTVRTYVGSSATDSSFDFIAIGKR